MQTYHYSVEVVRRTGSWRTHNTEINGRPVQYERLPDSAIGDTLDGERGSGSGTISEVVQRVVDVLSRWSTAPDVVAMWSIAHDQNEWYAADWAEVAWATTAVRNLTTKPRS